LFVDVNMPEIDGLEVTKRVRRMINAREIADAKII
jgi:CheY-like chemotaxis protein